MRRLPPLSFFGNKARVRKYIIPLLEKLDDNTIFVDLFGGSFYCSYLCHQIHPRARVICNDYDDYRDRLKHINETYSLFMLIDNAYDTSKYKTSDKLNVDDMHKVHQVLRDWRGYVDSISLQTKLLFSGRSIDVMQNLDNDSVAYYCRPTKNELKPVDDYLDGIEFRCCDWRELFDEFKDNINVCFICDPPYLNTDCSRYKNKGRYEPLRNSLDVIDVLACNASYIFFTSPKSGIIECINYMRKYIDAIKPFDIIEVNKAPINKSKGVNIDVIMHHIA